MERCQKKEKAIEKKKKAKEDQLGITKKRRGQGEPPHKSKTNPEEKKSQYLPIRNSSIGDSPMKEGFKSEKKLDQLIEDS